MTVVSPAGFSLSSVMLGVAVFALSYGVLAYFHWESTKDKREAVRYIAVGLGIVTTVVLYYNPIWR